jgi:hypothetical protein
MLYQAPFAAGEPRRGIVLLVVISLLAIFAAAGLAFVYYADGESTASTAFRQGTTFTQPDLDPEMLFAVYLQQLIYGHNDDPTGVYSALRGHDLLRNMYGYGKPTTGNQDNQPYNGTGRWHTGTVATAAAGGKYYMNPFGIDDYYLFNYTFFNDPGNLYKLYLYPHPLNPGVPNLQMVRDPEIAYTPPKNAGQPPPWRTDPNTPNKPANPKQPQFGFYTGGFNPSWTYPDMSNIFLAAVKADGTLLASSFERSRWMPASAPGKDYFNTMAPTSWMWFTDVNPSDPNKTVQKWLPYQVLRPRPADNLVGTEVFEFVNGQWTLYTAPKAQGGQPSTRSYFPAPATATGDVQNARGWTTGNDSFWMYLGSPIMQLPDGRKYTMLYAALIVDLDGRVNPNVHGNVRGLNPKNPGQPAHVSNQGWGPWEVNLSQVLTQGGNEWTKLFVGDPALVAPPPAPLRLIGRYGPDLQPTGAGGTGNAIPKYSMIDFDGCTRYTPLTGGTMTTKLPMPTGTSCFPLFPAGFENGGKTSGANTEQTNHPCLYNPVAPQYTSATAYDRTFAVSNQEKLMRYGDIGTESATSELFDLLRQNMGNARIRNLLTVLSADRDQAGMQPAWWLASTPNSNLTTVFRPSYTLPQTFKPPSPAPGPMPALPLVLDGFGPQLFPTTLTKPVAPAPMVTDFGTNDWRSATAGLGRIDVNRTLTAYPNPDPATGQIAIKNYPTFLTAQNDRQTLAYDIFTRLVKVTGAYDSSNYNPKAKPPQNQLPTPNDIATLRWLAQYAVNMVDYIDSDDYVTPFNWLTGPTNPPPANSPNAQFIKDMTKPGGPLANILDQFVFGNEMPRVLINEVYAEYDNLNLPSETGPKSNATAFRVNVWVELFNPLATDQAVSNLGAVPLNRGTGKNVSATYQIVLTTGSNTSLLSTADPPTSVNLLGDPDNTTWPGQGYTNGVVYSTPSNFIFPKPADQIQQSDSATKGFYVIGPDAQSVAKSHNPGQPTLKNSPNTPYLQIPQMSYQVSAPPVDPKINPTGAPLPPTVMVRRLLCPALPYQPNQNQPMFNPYITVDFMDNVHLNVGATNNKRGLMPAPPPVEQRTSWGRPQPYDNSNPGVMVRQAASKQPPPKGQPEHSFFLANNNYKNGKNVIQQLPPYEWMLHMDRQLISPMELLHVAACRPHQVTHLFKYATNSPYQKTNHAAYWMLQDANTPLYRIFDMLQTGPHTLGVKAGGRIPGKININTVWDLETLMALCDPHTPPANNFTAADVQAIFNDMTSSRTVNVVQGNPMPGAGDTPFKGLGIGNWKQAGGIYPEGNGLADTIFRQSKNRGTARMFEITGNNFQPFQRYELYNKTFNTMTTRSNVFAVWVTVGFFEVLPNSTSQPPKLGAELGLAEGRNVRHRMFAIIDRSVMTNNPGPPSTPFNPHAQPDLVPHFSIIE